MNKRELIDKEKINDGIEVRLIKIIDNSVSIGVSTYEIEIELKGAGYIFRQKCNTRGQGESVFDDTYIKLREIFSSFT